MTAFSQDQLTGIPGQSSTQGVAFTPFAAASIVSSNDDTDVVTVYVLNDNAEAGTLDASKLPAGSAVAPAGGTLVMISGSPATVQTALRALIFQPTAQPAGTSQTAHLTVVISNLADGEDSLRSITNAYVDAVGSNVALTGLPGASEIADSGAVALAPSAVVTSVAGDAVSVHVSLSNAALGSLQTGTVPAGITLTRGTDGSVTLSGGAADVSTALRAMVFDPVQAVVGSTAQETVSVDSLDTVNGTTASGTIALAIDGSLPAVTLSGVPAAAAVPGGAAIDPFSALTLQDLSGGTLTATVSIAGGSGGSFDPGASAQGAADGVSRSLSTDGSTLTLSGAAADVQSALRALAFDAANPASGTAEVDLGLVLTTATGQTASATERLAVSCSGTAPVLAGNGTVELSGGSGLLYPAAVVSGPSTAVQATIDLSDPSVATFDEQTFSAAEQGGSVSFVFAENGAELRISGDADDVGAALRQVALVATTPPVNVQTRETATLSLSADAGAASYATTVLVDGPALVADGVSGIAGAATVAAAASFTPFAAAVIADSNTGDQADAVVSGLPASDAFGLAGLVAGSATLSADGRSLTLRGSAATVQADLRAVSVSVGGAADFSLAVSISNAAGGATLSGSGATEAVTVKAPAYGSDTGHDDTGHVFTVGADATQTAEIDLSANPNDGIVVFGGDAALDLTAGHSIVVLNGRNQTGAVSIDSLGGNTVWAGVAPIDYTAGGHSRFILGATENETSTVRLHGGTASDSNEFDIWNQGGGTQTVQVDGVSGSTVFVDDSDLDFTGGNATVVLNGPNQGGAVALHSDGGNTVWAGSAALDLFEGAGNDTLLLTGAAAETVHGATSAQGGTTSVLSLGNTGAFTYDGGAKAAELRLSGGTNTVHAGSAGQSISMSGGGSLAVLDDAGATGAQLITMAASSTASLRFVGGTNPASLRLGGGAATITAGADTSIVGGSGAATIDLSDAVRAVLTLDGSLVGNVDVMGFAPARGSVLLSHVTSSTITGGSLVVTFTDGAHATFQGYASADNAGIVFG